MDEDAAVTGFPWEAILKGEAVVFVGFVGDQVSEGSAE